MEAMFYGCSSFEGDISQWDVSNVTVMSNMFDVAQSFNGDISSWNISNVEYMRGMFWNAHSFNQDISNWNVSNVRDMFKMFLNAQSFDQDISNWDVSNVTNMEEMFNGTNSLSNENKCAIHNSFSLNNNWLYNWSTYCNLNNQIDLITPQEFSLHQNYPNPFNPLTTLRYELPEDSYVEIVVHDMLGNVVNNLVKTNQSSGYKSVQWNATSNQGQALSAGVYFYTIEAGGFRQTRKMILIK